MMRTLLQIREKQIEDLKQRIRTKKRETEKTVNVLRKFQVSVNVLREFHYCACVLHYAGTPSHKCKLNPSYTYISSDHQYLE